MALGPGNLRVGQVPNSWEKDTLLVEQMKIFHGALMGNTWDLPSGNGLVEPL